MRVARVWRKIVFFTNSNYRNMYEFNIYCIRTMLSSNSLLVRQAKALINKGFSYNKISERLNIAKSTLYYWVKNSGANRYTSAARLKHLTGARVLAAAANRKKRSLKISSIQNRVLSEIEQFPFENLLVQKALLACLYWAEGSKTVPGYFKFANTDPSLCFLFITLLRNTLPISEYNIRICLYLHHYHNVARTKDFWSKLLRVPKTQFEKIYIKRRKKSKKKKKNFAGICFVKYGRGAENLRQEVLYFARMLQEKFAPCAHSSTDRT